MPFSSVCCAALGTTNRGKFITFEGPEGSGKSTHASILVERMKSAGHRALLVREPGGTRAGETIRGLLGRLDEEEPMCRETELFLFLASRAQLVRQVIIPSLGEGIHVVCDRFADSTTAYQGYGRECDLPLVLKMNDFATCGLAPDLTVLLDIAVADGFARVEGRDAARRGARDRMERESIEFHEKVRRGYLELARLHPERFARVDAFRSQAEVREDVWREARRVLEA